MYKRLIYQTVIYFPNAYMFMHIVYTLNRFLLLHVKHSVHTKHAIFIEITKTVFLFFIDII